MKYLLSLIGALVVVATSNTVAGDTKPGIAVTFPKPNQQEIHCLAQNIYFESRSDNMAGQFAVADVVINRVLDKRYPDSICAVVYQGPISKWHLETHGKKVPVKNMCQFSWYCDGKSDEPKDNDAWERAKLIAYQISVHRQFRGITEGATHYHAFYVDPSWAQRYQQIGTIGLHRFYRAE